MLTSKHFILQSEWKRAFCHFQVFSHPLLHLQSTVLLVQTKIVQNHRKLITYYTQIQQNIQFYILGSVSVHRYSAQTRLKLPQNYFVLVLSIMSTKGKYIFANSRTPEVSSYFQMKFPASLLTSAIPSLSKGCIASYKVHRSTYGLH